MLKGYELLTMTQQKNLAKAARNYANWTGITHFVVTYRDNQRWHAEVIDEQQWFTRPERDEEIILYTYRAGASRGEWTI